MLDPLPTPHQIVNEFYMNGGTRAVADLLSAATDLFLFVNDQSSPPRLPSADLAVAHTLQEALQILGMRQKDFARRCGIEEGTISNILNGKSKRIQPETVNALAKGLGIDVPEALRLLKGTLCTQAA